MLMNKWVMIRNDAVGPVPEYYAGLSNHPGVSHDDLWHIFTTSPEQETLDAQGYETYPAEGEEASVSGLGLLMIEISASLEPHRAIVSDRAVFQALYRTPEYRLWCGKYESETAPEFISDKADAGLPSILTIEQASAAIKNAIQV